MRAVLTFVAAAVAAAAFAAPRAAADPPLGHANGSFVFAYFAVESLEFNAHDRGLPAEDRGDAGYCNLTAGFCYRAELVCVSVVGNTARFGYVIPNQPGVPPFIVGFSVVWQVVDLARHAPGDTAGYVNTVVPDPTLALACDTAGSPQSPILQGDVRVKPHAQAGLLESG
jgi:hypothetical protein